MRVIVTITTIGTIYLVVRHYRINLQFMKAKEIARPSGKSRLEVIVVETLRSMGLIKWMVLEIVICSLHSPPGINALFFIPNAASYVPYSLDILLTFFPLQRFYLLWRVFAGSSFWADERADRVCREICNTDGGSMFALKCELEERPYTMILLAKLVLILVCGFALRAFEL